MKKTTFLTLIFSLIAIIAIAQKKKDLLLEIEALKSEIESTQASLATSQKNEKVSKVKLSSLEEQVSGLKQTNASLLTNLNLMTETSKKRSENVSKTFQILKEKESQVESINSALTRIDSLKLVTLTQFKEGIGDSIPVKLVNGSVIISIPNAKLFEDTDKDFKVNESGKTVLEQLAKILSSNPGMQITVQGNSNALAFKDESLIDNWDLSARQAASVVRVLQNDHEIAPKRMNAMGKSEYATEGVDTVTRIIIDPDFNTFYTLISEQMKNQF